MSKEKIEEKGPRFSGGDSFEGVKKIINDIMMKNELKNGYGAYQISFAGTPNSGLSYGANQRDMSVRSDAVNDFIKILKNATDASGNFIIKKSELSAITGDKNCNLTIKNRTPEQVFGKNLYLVNTALSSTYGMEVINKSYLDCVNYDVEHIEKAIHHIMNPAAKEFYSTDFGKILLYDYHNQYDLNLKGPFLNNYIDGYYHNSSKNIYGTNENIAAPIDQYTLEHHKDYLHSTEQFHDKPKMVDSRLNQTLNVLKTYHITEENPFLFTSSLFENLSENPTIPDITHYDFEENLSSLLIDLHESSFDLWSTIPSFYEETPLLFDQFFVAPTYSPLYEYEPIYYDSALLLQDLLYPHSFTLDESFYNTDLSYFNSSVFDIYTPPYNYIDNYTSNIFNTNFGSNSGFSWSFNNQTEPTHSQSKIKYLFLDKLLKECILPTIEIHIEEPFYNIVLEDTISSLCNPEFYALG